MSFHTFSMWNVVRVKTHLSDDHVLHLKKHQSGRSIKSYSFLPVDVVGKSCLFRGNLYSNFSQNKNQVDSSNAIVAASVVEPHLVAADFANEEEEETVMDALAQQKRVYHHQR